MYRLDLVGLESKITNWLESLTDQEEIPKDILFQKIENMEGKGKPGLDIFSEKQRKTYNTDLLKALKKAVNSTTLSKTEVKSFYIRYLIEASSKNQNSEFDILIILKVRPSVSDRWF